MNVYVDPQGDLQFIYQEEINMEDLGASTIRRASEVEPIEDSQWCANLARLGGPMLGPFKNRSEAIEAELAWIESLREKSTIRFGVSK